MSKYVTFALLFLCSVLMVNAQKRTFYSEMDLKAPVRQKVQTPNDTLDYISASGTIYGITNGGYVMGVNKYGDLGKYQRFDLADSYLLKGCYFYTKVKTITGAADTVQIVIKNANADGSPGATISSSPVLTSALTAAGWNFFNLSNFVPGGKSFFIGLEWNSSIDDTFALACDTYNLGYGDLAKRAWEKDANGVYGDVYTDWGGMDVDLWIGMIGEKILPISSARIDANADYIPDHVGDTLTVSGVVFTPNYQTTSRSYYIYDGTGGICTFKNGLTSAALSLGDSIVVRGQIQHYNGLTELAPLTDDQIWIVKTGATLPEPLVLAPGAYMNNTEQYEGMLVQVKNLSKMNGAWPAVTKSGTINMTNGTDTVALRIDSDTDIDGTTEPTWPSDVIGVVTQYTTGAITTGYQLQPRYAATDFPSSTPVELTSLSANVNGKSVLINWTTGTEKNNMGFEIQRSSDKVNFSKIGYVNGNGTTLETKKYSFVDNNAQSVKSYYRLKQMDYDGAFTYSTVIEVEIGTVSSFSLDQNYPNPFNPSTIISYTLPVNSNVKIIITNALGETIKELTNEIQQSGVHVMNFNASGISSGVYFYTIQASPVDGSKTFSASKKMILVK